jgi:hypothetical protein
MNKLYILSLLLTASSAAFADSTQKGKILRTEGHSNPNCRTVLFKENGSGSEKLFRIKDVAGDDDVSSVILTALVAQKDVQITYDPTETTGCGSEPKIIYVAIYN